MAVGQLPSFSNGLMGASARPAVIALRTLAFVWIAALFTKELLGWNTPLMPHTAIGRIEQILTTNKTAEDHATNTGTIIPHTSITLGHIQNKVAFMVETQYTDHLVPLILHFHGVLGPDWPIVFFTTQEVIQKHLGPSHSAIWQRAVTSGAVVVIPIPESKGFDLTDRVGVNLFLVDSWVWENLAPAKHVLLFQSDSMICANSPHKIEDFFHWDFIGPPPLQDRHWYHGGLTLRNRTMIMEILSEPHDWLAETKAGTDGGGEDIWFATKMEARGGKLPDWPMAIQFAEEFDWNVQAYKTPFGYHKVQDAPQSMDAISAYCPEIALAMPGVLPPAP